MSNNIYEKTLYGLTKKNKVYVWNISVSEQTESLHGEIVITRGLLDGKKHKSLQVITSGKNIGKINETTPVSQAVFNATSKVRKKLDDGYAETIEESRKKFSELLKPMLAQSYEKHKSKLKYPCVAQPKLDGIRCLARKSQGMVTLYSRQGKILDLVPHINNALNQVLQDGECTDGELYVHTWDFQKIVSAIKKVSENTPMVEYHVYDCPNMEKRETPFHKRFTPANQSKFANENNILRSVQTMPIDSETQLRDYEELCINNGYEGIMARNADSKYLFGYRSSDLLKVKRFIDNEYKIVDISEGTGVEKGCAIFLCETLEGKTFGVRPTGTHAERKIVYKNQKDYLGKLLTVKYQELSNDGVPRFPVGLHIRESWDMDLK